MKTLIVKEQTVLLDDDDFERATNQLWNINKLGYVYSQRNFFLALHTFILGKAPIGQEIHHKDDNKLNNQKSNLSYVSKAVHRITNGKRRDNSSGYKGVGYCRVTGLWRAYIAKDSKVKSLGRFTTPEEAAKAYDKEAITLHGTHAYLNFGKVTQ